MTRSLPLCSLRCLLYPLTRGRRWSFVRPLVSPVAAKTCGGGRPPLGPPRGKSAAITGRAAHEFVLQLQRQDKSNQRLTTREIDRHCKLDGAGDKLPRETMLHLHWSARSYYRVLKAARTIADLAEAIQYRRSLRER